MEALGQADAVDATLDYYDDPVDVYRVTLTGHEQLTRQARRRLAERKRQASSSGGRARRASRHEQAAALRAAQSAASGGTQRLAFTAPGRGWYYVEHRERRPAAARTRSL